jgi:hypothetical protein
MNNKWYYLYLITIGMISLNLTLARLNLQSTQVRQQAAFRESAQPQGQARLLARQPTAPQTSFPSQSSLPPVTSEKSAPAWLVSSRLSTASDALQAQNYKTVVSTTTDLLEQYPNMDYDDQSLAYGYRAAALLGLNATDRAIEDLVKLADLSQQHGDKETYAVVVNKLQAISQSAASIPAPSTDTTPIESTAMPLPTAPAMPLPTAPAMPLPTAPAMPLPDPSVSRLSLPKPVTDDSSVLELLPAPVGGSALPDAAPSVPNLSR